MRQVARPHPAVGAKHLLGLHIHHVVRFHTCFFARVDFCAVSPQGFTPGLECSSCAQLGTFGLAVLEDDCRKGCGGGEEVDVAPPAVR